MNERPRDEGLPAGNAHFATTHWSVVLAVGQEDSTQAMVALEKLCRAYWYPLYNYVRGRGYAVHDAQDLIQGFFALLLKRQALHNVVPGRGKFRSFLLTALNHFLADEYTTGGRPKNAGAGSSQSPSMPRKPSSDIVWNRRMARLPRGSTNEAGPRR